MAEDDDFFDKAIEGFVHVRARTRARSAPARSRALVHESIYDRFMERALEARSQAIKQGNPLDPATMIGAQASNEQLEKILSLSRHRPQEGAEVLAGGDAQRLPRRPGRRLLRQADGVPGPQPDAHLPGGDSSGRWFR